MANRFTQWNPQEFQQTYEPLPMNQMIQLGQIGQQRNDAIDGAIGKAAGDMTFEGGLATQGLASTMTKEYNDQLNALSDRWGTDRNSSAAIQGLSKLKQQIASDPRMVTLNSDKALKPFVLANMNKPEYGKSLKYKSYDDQTGQFNIGDMNSIIGRDVTPQDYGLMENQGDLKTYSPYIEKIKPLIDEEYDLVINPETKKPEYRHKTTNEVLDYDVVKDRSEGFLNSFMNDDGTINIEMLTSVDPVMAANVEWKAYALEKDGRGGQYDWNSLVDNYMNVASLSFYTKGKQNITGVGKEDKPEKGDPLVSNDLFMLPVNNVSFVASTNTPGLEITSDEKLRNAVGVNSLYEDELLGISLLDNLYTPPLLPKETDPTYTTKLAEKEKYDITFNEKQDKQRLAIYEDQYKKLMLKPENNSQIIDGVEIEGRRKDLIEAESQANADALIRKRKMGAHAILKAKKKAMDNGELIPTEENKKSIIKKAQEDKDKILTFLVDRAFTNIASKSKKERNELFKQFPYLSKTVAHPYYDETENWNWNDDSNIRSDEEKARGAIRVNTPYITQNREELIKELGKLNMGVGVRKATGTKAGTVTTVENRNLGDHYNNLTKNIEKEALRKDYSKYYERLDKTIKETFATPQVTNMGYAIFKPGEELTTANIPESHALLAKVARTKALEKGIDIYNATTGNQINNILGDGTTFGGGGLTLDKLVLAGTDGKTEDFTNKKNQPVFNPQEFYFHHDKNKWFMRGYYTAEDGDKTYTSTRYDVDINQNINSMLTNPEIQSIMAKDRAQDILNETLQGTATKARMGQTEDVKNTFGDIHVTQTYGGKYEIKGNTYDPVTEEVVSINEYIMDHAIEMQLDPRSLTKEQAAKILGDTFLIQNQYTDWKQSTSVDEYGRAIDSRDYGIMQINDKTWSNNAAKRSVVSSGGTDWSKILFQDIVSNPEFNVEFGSDIVRNTTSGWNNWTTYNDATKGKPNPNWKSTYDEIQKPGGWERLKSGKHKDLIKMIEKNYDNSSSPITKTNEFGLSNTQVAFLISMAESGGNNNVEPGKNYKK